MSINPNNKRDSRPMAGNHNTLPLPRSSQTKRHRQEDFYPIASDPNSVYASSEVGKAGPSSAIYTEPSVGSLGPDSDGDYEVNDQMSTEPVPADFDYQAVGAPSSPPNAIHHIPVTRSKARASARALDRSENGQLVDLISNVDLQEPEENDEHLRLPKSHRQNRAPKKAKSKADVLNIDGSVDERASISAEGSADSAVGSGSSLLSLHTDDDDVYRLSATDAYSDDSEASGIADITGRSDRKCKGRATMTTCSSKSKKKKASKKSTSKNANCKSPVVGETEDEQAHTAKRRAAKTMGGHPANKPPKSQKPAAGSQVADVQDGESAMRTMLVPVSRQNTQVPKQTHFGNVPASHSAIQKALSPLAERTIPTHRKPKKPFDADNFDERHTSPQGVSPSHGNTSNYQDSTARTRLVDPSRSTKVDPVAGKVAKTISQKTRSTLSMPSVKPESEQGGKSSQAKQKSRDVSHKQLNAHPNELSDPFTLQSPNQHSHSTDVEYGHSHPQIRPSYKAPSRIPGDFKQSTGPTERVNAARKRKAPWDDIQVSAAISPHVSPDHAHHRSPADFAGKADPKDHVAAGTILPLNYDRIPEENEEVSGDHGSSYDSSVPMQVWEVSRSPLVEEIAARVGAPCGQAVRQTPLSPKPMPQMRSPARSEGEESLHPSSMIWAEKLAHISRKKHLTSMPFEVPEEIVSSDETPSIERNAGNPKVSERELTLQHRRAAVCESVKEVTTVMLQHMQSKEATVNKIIENYRRNGQQLIDRVLERQAGEFKEVVSAFSRKCERLGKSLDEGAALARRVRERASNEDNEFRRAWNQRKKELDDEIRESLELLNSL